ncbi:transcriptional regulator, MerR family/albicidin resistance domain protein [Burkholderia oklahomensis]|uniref:Transcriptional regulator, MerR family/albicidin resistance domain protein n=1 Tax=Burkholderia oklahomensis TaxID=342113 RepID=A0AAI8B6V9_9BURK|nr:transcriptional regulator, MerR family/albicidin resistance domain protein [Burkholderia oklahomensis]AJX33411.1 regulatory, MerR:Albicidin resistance domain protein [Burkholderia oklahomensis C6786]AOI42325.1 MerR family transcriptional regulator [Burkholderia oklahomensis EO147]AOI45890.1 MerR family transcriptional regulator [Burkholderia oklahomensis C6786]KUY52747.1 MerR family transcriptional regulator [Burkholderia oklahomensis EO147]
MRIYERYLSPDEARFMRANYGERAMEWPQLMADPRHGGEARSHVGSCGASAMCAASARPVLNGSR